MTMIDPAIVPQRTLYTGAKMPAVGMGTFGSSKVLGFTGSDNQGILGLEAKYDALLSGIRIFSF